jgi:dolichyl-phosphate-mannose--protein O-mannosyl transferase
MNEQQEMVTLPKKLMEQIKSEHLLMFGALSCIKAHTASSVKLHVVGDESDRFNVAIAKQSHDIAAKVIAQVTA